MSRTVLLCKGVFRTADSQSNYDMMMMMLIIIMIIIYDDNDDDYYYYYYFATC